MKSDNAIRNGTSIFVGIIVAIAAFVRGALLLPLIVTFLVFLLFIPRHRAMLLLMPIPAAFLCAPPLVHAARLAQHGAWRQHFGDINVPSVGMNG